MSSTGEPDTETWTTPAAPVAVSGSPNEPPWASVYRAEAPRLMRLATALVGRDDAYDLVADTVGRVVRRPDVDAIDHLPAYLTRAVVNGATDRARSRRRRDDREARAGRLVVTSSVDPANGLDVRRALDRLSPQQRAIAFLVYWDDLTIPDVAVRLDVSEGTVRRQLARAKDRLREVLK
jgi:RNA polymerase sigma factor (sigma-70 family)